MRAGRRARLLRAVQWGVIAALVAVSIAAEAAGHAVLSWLADGAAVAAWLVFRRSGGPYAERVQVAAFRSAPGLTCGGG